jgi:tRNA threonylcarbamoyladenosine biosynthesis protein TsaB
MAAAKGITQALTIPIITVPTFEALALQIAQFAQENSSFIIANKVGKDEVYYAKFYIKSNNYIFQEELKIVPNSQLSDFIQDSKVFGNLEVSNHKLLNVYKISAPDAEYVAMWANRFGKKINYPEINFIEPNYLKDFVVKEKKI